MGTNNHFLRHVLLVSRRLVAHYMCMVTKYTQSYTIETILIQHIKQTNMKQLQQLLLVLSLFISMQVCTSAQTATIEFENGPDIMAKTQEILEAFKTGDVEKQLSYFAEDAKIYGLLGAASEMTKSEYRSQMELVRDNYSKTVLSNVAMLPIKAVDTFNEGEWTAIWCVISQTGNTSGATLEYPMHIAVLWENGKIKTSINYVDMLNIYEASGFKVVPPSN